MVLAADGNLYGSTYYGGSDTLAGEGLIFKITADGTPPCRLAQPRDKFR